MVGDIQGDQIAASTGQKASNVAPTDGSALSWDGWGCRNAEGGRSTQTQRANHVESGRRDREQSDIYKNSTQHVDFL